MWAAHIKVGGELKKNRVSRDLQARVKAGMRTEHYTLLEEQSFHNLGHNEKTIALCRGVLQCLLVAQ